MIARLEERGRRIKRGIIDVAYAANKGHIGSALSVSDLITSVLSETRGLGSKDEHRDRVVLSKGHASLAFYVGLAEFGVIPRDQLSTYCQTDSLLQTHPDHELDGVDFITGSLGQGIGFGVGVAMAEKVAPQGVRTRVLLSDSELNEGSTWESAAIAGTHCLKSLTVVLDQNGQQAMGFSEDVMRVGAPEVIWPQLGWEVSVVDGHNLGDLTEAIKRDVGAPHLIVAKTVSGKGVPYMERKIEWHYMPMNSDQYSIACTELSK
jgi:transketolase